MSRMYTAANPAYASNDHRQEFYLLQPKPGRSTARLATSTKHCCGLHGCTIPKRLALANRSSNSPQPSSAPHHCLSCTSAAACGWCQPQHTTQQAHWLPSNYSLTAGQSLKPVVYQVHMPSVLVMHQAGSSELRLRSRLGPAGHISKHLLPASSLSFSQSHASPTPKLMPRDCHKPHHAPLP